MTLIRAPRMRRPLRVAVLAASTFLLFGQAHAANNPYDESQFPTGGMTLRAIGTETGSWESNPLMQINGAKPLWGSITSPELILMSKTPTSELKGDVLVNENIFDRSDFNSTDIHAKAGLNEQLQTWSAGAQITTDYDTTRTSELFPVGLNGVLLNESVRHLGMSLAPQISYAPNKTNKFSLAGTISDSQYDKPVFANYGIASVTPSYTHNFDPLNAGVFSFNAQRYQTTSGPLVVVDSVGPSIGWLGTLTPRLSANVNVGVQTTRQYGSGAVQVPWKLQYTFSGDLSFKGQQDTTDFIMSRADYPFGNGTDSLLTTFQVKEVHNLNDNFSVNVMASYQAADYQTNATGNLDYLVSGSGGLTYHATDRLDLTATYQYRRETLKNTPGTATDNMATIGLTYHPRSWSL